VSSQTGVAPPQSVLAVHCTQRPCCPQTGVDVPAQSVLAKHWTQVELAVLHFGALAAH